MPSLSHRIKLRAPAKVNLALAVLGELPDGYHRVETVLQTVSLWDEITLQPRRQGIALVCDEPTVPADESNLCYRAAALLLKESCATSRRVGVAITLCKNIPAQAGLGGGSSDAAATLVGLNRLWGLGLTRRELAVLAAELGADVPFFLYGGSAIGTGRGDRIERLGPGPVIHLVLARASQGVSTSWAYARWPAGAGKHTSGAMLRALATGSPKAIAAALRNDLEPGVLARRRDIADLKARVLDQGALGALMAGSGSAVFGVFADHKGAQETGARMSKNGVWVRVVRTIGSGASFAR